MPNKIRFALFAVLLGAFCLARAQPPPSVAGFKLAEFPRAGEPPTLRLVSRGAEPRRELRYRFTAGAVHRMSMTMRMAIAMEIDGRQAPASKLPVMRMLMEARIVAADDQQFRYEFGMPTIPELLETEGMQPAMLENMKKGLGQLTSMRGHAVLTNRGIMKEGSIEIGPGADPSLQQMLQSMRQSMEQTSVPLPVEAVGVGAQWKVLQRFQADAMPLYQVSTFTVRRIEGPAVTMGLELEQFAPRQDMPVPEAAKGARMELIALQARGQGQTIVDLRGLVPRANASLESLATMNVQAEGKTMHMKMTNRMQVQIEPAAPK